jgi:hypothetical protein
VTDAWTPPLHVCETGGRCRLWVGGYACGEGDTLQEAADDLVRRLAALAAGWSPPGLGLRHATIALPDPRWLEFLAELAETAATGGDLRALVFG